MADNYVQIRIKATDTAKPDLDSLRADLDELGSKVDTAKIDADDDDAKIKLLEINAELARLNKRVASARIDVAGAAKAEADLAKVEDRFDRLRESADKAKDRAVEDMDGIREHASRLDELVSRLGVREGLLGKLLFGSAGGEGAAAEAEKAASKIKESVSGIVGLLRQLPGGGGAEGGGSALGMLGSLSGLAAGGGGIAAGIGAVLVELDGLLSGFAAAGAGAGAFAILAAPAFEKVKAAIGDTHAELMKLSPDERGAVYGIRELEHSLDRMSKAFEPDAFKVFNQGLKVANELLPHLKPFADTFASSLDGLLKQVSKFAQSKGFEDWLKQFHQLEGPAIHAIGEGLGQVGVAFGKLLTIMSKKDVVNAINIAFKVLSGTIDALRFIIARTMLRWDQWQKLVEQVARDTSADAAAMRKSFDDMRHAVANDFDTMRHTIADWGHNVASIFDEARANIARWAADVGRDAERVVAYFRALPGRIMGALESLGSRLFSFGAHIISMLADGIRSAIGDVTGAIGSVVSEITSHLPFSPAKKGPLSGRGDPVLTGRRIVQYLAQGMDSGLGSVSAAADRVAGATIPHGGAGGAGGRLVLQVTGQGSGLDALFFTWLRRGIRTRGGLQRALGP